MDLLKGLLGAVLGGVLGGALWAGVASATGYEINLVAIVVAGLVAFGMGMGVQGRGGVAAGLCAAVIAVFSILGAKVGVAHILAEQYMAEQDLTITEDDARDTLAMTVYDEYLDEGREVTQPEEDDAYPVEVWNESSRRWHAMSPAERKAYRAGLERDVRAEFQQAGGVFTIITFIRNFGLMDVVCLVLATGMAFKTASMRVQRSSESPEVEEAVDVQAPAIFRVAPPPEAVGPGMLAGGGSSSGVPASSTAGAGPAAGAATPPLTGLGIFSMLGQEPQDKVVAPRRPMAPSSVDAPAPQVGLINLDVREDRRAA